ncbi:hypothetical protein R1flu_018584 [Riccia fluitans]|uniref:AB hydrolase-1 domain-containing protein n=1 Tax=Riccia fluitans TaxID=41844 RepID=A0ABD1ZHS3_9MARC
MRCYSTYFTTSGDSKAGSLSNVGHEYPLMLVHAKPYTVQTSVDNGPWERIQLLHRDSGVETKGLEMAALQHGIEASAGGIAGFRASSIPHAFPCSLRSTHTEFNAGKSLRTSSQSRKPKARHSFVLQAIYVDDDDEGYLLDAPVSEGDGFSFSGGKYSNEVGRAEEWYAKGRIVKAYPVKGGLEKAKDPLFGLPMGEGSQTSDDFFRWFCVEEGDRTNPTILLVHGFPSQSYSYRKVMPSLSSDYHVVAFDWVGFGFSDKPQPKYGFDYTTDEFTTALSLLVEALEFGESFTIVAQGYFAPAVVRYAKSNQTRIDQLILINPPISDAHTALPSALSAFSAFLLGEVFAQDPLKASDKPLTECGPYLLDEEDAMVYRRPYLTSGASGFALTAISRSMKSELKGAVGALRQTLGSGQWSKPLSIVWGMKDRWLAFKDVEEFAKSSGARLVQLEEVGHHAQEDYGEEVGLTIKSLMKRTVSSYQ